MREDLLGYLLGALDEAERAKVQAALESDPELAAECAHLEQVIAPLSEDEAWIEPPGRLAERTIAFVEAAAENEVAATNADREILKRQMVLDALLVDASVTDESKRKRATDKPLALSAVRKAELGSARRWTLADAAVAASICIVAAMLFFPAIAHSQRQAAISQCQNKLHQLSKALFSYSDRQGHFPFVPASGNLGVAGIYAPILKESGHIESDSEFLCPSSTLAEEVNKFAVPSIAELEQQSGKELLTSHRKMGGSFGYAFGYDEDGKGYRANINHNRERFALLADAPSLHLKDRQSANHGGCGQNVLFEDGHAQYLNQCRADDVNDNVYLSDRGYVEAGRHWNDAVIGNSWALPVLHRP